MYTLEGVSSVAKFVTAYEESNKNEIPTFLSVVCSLFLNTMAFYVMHKMFHSRHW